MLFHFTLPNILKADHLILFELMNINRQREILTYFVLLEELKYFGFHTQESREFSAFSLHFLLKTRKHLCCLLKYVADLT
jgi:hypothetical protein